VREWPRGTDGLRRASTTAGHAARKQNDAAINNRSSAWQCSRSWGRLSKNAARQPTSFASSVSNIRKPTPTAAISRIWYCPSRSPFRYVNLCLNRKYPATAFRTERETRRRHRYAHPCEPASADSPSVALRKGELAVSPNALIYLQMLSGLYSVLPICESMPLIDRWGGRCTDAHQVNYLRVEHAF
jgi:hypothetical protein